MEIQLGQYLKLIEDHARVTYYKIRKPSWHTIRDLVQEGAIVFLLAKRDYSSEKKASFKTFLTMRLRNHFVDIVKKSYKYTTNEYNLYRIRLWDSVDPAEVTQVTLLFEIFTPEEFEYIKTMLLLHKESYHIRRKIARETLGISYGREVKLRNSIRSKVKK